MSATSDGTANYLQLASDPTKGTIDPTEANGRISFDASNPDFVNYNNELLIGMNYPHREVQVATPMLGSSLTGN